MAFVTCGQFKTSQEAQDAAALKVENQLLDCAENAKGVTIPDNCADKKQGGVITVKKIKQAIAGDVEIAVIENGGLSGKGTKEEPLKVDVDNLATQLGGKTSGKNLLKALKDNGLLGDGLDLNENGQLIVMTEEILDASGKVHQFYSVKKEK